MVRMDTPMTTAEAIADMEQRLAQITDRFTPMFDQWTAVAHSTLELSSAVVHMGAALIPIQARMKAAGSSEHGRRTVAALDKVVSYYQALLLGLFAAEKMSSGTYTEIAAEMARHKGMPADDPMVFRLLALSAAAVEELPALLAEASMWVDDENL